MGVPASLIAAIAVPELFGSLIGRVTRKEFAWFATQRKPSWEPPAPLFGIAWTVLYAVMGYASWRVWIQGGWQAHQKALSLYVVQLAFNLSWPVVFFKKKQLGLAQGINLVLLGLASLTASAFYKVDPLAGKLMLPYIAWVAFANALNYSVWRKNPQATSAVEDLAHEPGKENPGEGRYNKPASASLSTAATRNCHSRQRTVSVHCSALTAPRSICRAAAARPFSARYAISRAAVPQQAAHSCLRQARVL